MTGRSGQIRHTTTAEMRLDEQSNEFQRCEAGNPTIWLPTGLVAIEFRWARLDETENHPQQPGNLGNVSRIACPTLRYT